MMKRLEKIIEEMKRRSIGVAVILKPENIYYFTGFFPSSFAALIIHREAELIISPMDSTRKEEIRINYKIVDNFSKIFKGIKSKRVGIEKDYIKYSFFEKYLKKEAVVGLEFLEDMRTVKDKREIELIKRGCIITEKIINEIAENLVSKTEKEVAAEIEYRLNKEAGVAFPTILASGKNSALPHHTPEMVKIDTDSLIIDAGAKVEHYCSDITRSFSLSDNKKYIEWREIVEEAQKAGIKECYPGNKASNVDIAVREIFKEYNVEKYFLHSTGHGLGLEVHEAPGLSKTSKEVLKEGMVVTIEPGLYGNFGIRIEDDIVVKKNPDIISGGLP